MSEQRKNDDSRFDRLVDGELNEQERRDLLTSLDHEPGGWRRCALAFLEAQCWKDVFGGLAAEPTRKPESAAPPATARPLHPHTRRLVHLRTAMAMAASFLAALLIGSWLPRGDSPHMAATGPANTAHQVAANDAPQATPKTREHVGGATVPEAAGGPWRMVTVKAAGEQPGKAVQLPAVERPNADENWLKSVPSAIPDEVVQALERTGHRVQKHRELVPVPMKDGRKLMVPVDQVDVHYIGNPAY